jgi:hypothetical protein
MSHPDGWLDGGAYRAVATLGGSDSAGPLQSMVYCGTLTGGAVSGLWKPVEFWGMDRLPPDIMMGVAELADSFRDLMRMRNSFRGLRDGVELGFAGWICRQKETVVRSRILFGDVVFLREQTEGL